VPFSRLPVKSNPIELYKLAGNFIFFSNFSKRKFDKNETSIYLVLDYPAKNFLARSQLQKELQDSFQLGANIGLSLNFGL
jgi:hypothetical protein